MQYSRYGSESWAAPWTNLGHFRRSNAVKIRGASSRLRARDLLGKKPVMSAQTGGGVLPRLPVTSTSATRSVTGGGPRGGGNVAKIREVSSHERTLQRKNLRTFLTTQRIKAQIASKESRESSQMKTRIEMSVMIEKLEMKSFLATQRIKAQIASTPTLITTRSVTDSVPRLTSPEGLRQSVPQGRLTVARVTTPRSDLMKPLAKSSHSGATCLSRKLHPWTTNHESVASKLAPPAPPNTAGFIAEDYGAYTFVKGAFSEDECAALRHRIDSCVLRTGREIDGETVYDTGVKKAEFPWLIKRFNSLLTAIYPDKKDVFSGSFARKYCAEKRCDFVPHYDKSDVSFIVALSPPGAYEGGGLACFADAKSSPARSDEKTLYLMRNNPPCARPFLRALQKSGRLEKHMTPLRNEGDIVIFRNDGPSGSLLHTVLPVTSGTRHSLISFWKNRQSFDTAVARELALFLHARYKYP